MTKPRLHQYVEDIPEGYHRAKIDPFVDYRHLDIIQQFNGFSGDVVIEVNISLSRIGPMRHIEAIHFKKESDVVLFKLLMSEYV